MKPMKTDYALVFALIVGALMTLVRVAQLEFVEAAPTLSSAIAYPIHADP